MRVLVISDSYKGSCSSKNVANNIEKGIKKVSDEIEVVKISIGDGGEGTSKSIISFKSGIEKKTRVLDPLGRGIDASYGIIDGDVAVLEMASASGLDLLSKDELNPLVTTTYGTGQLIKNAMESGCKKIYLGIGGSATNDGGVGMAQALGYSFKDKEGREVSFGGGHLKDIVKIDTDKKHELLTGTEIIVMSDVQNVLLGDKGAAKVYGPQKGANARDVELLDKSLRHLAILIERTLNKDIRNLKGAGAAGGLGAGLVAFCNGELKSGIEVVLDLLEIDSIMPSVDLVITGEGSIDGQSIYGKVPVGVAKRAKKYDKPVIAIVGGIGAGAELVYDYGIDVLMDIVNAPMDLKDAIKNVDELIEKATVNIMRAYLL